MKIKLIKDLERFDIQKIKYIKIDKPISHYYHIPDDYCRYMYMNLMMTPDEIKNKSILNSYTEELVQDLILQFSSSKRGKLAITEEEFEEDSKEFFNEFKKITKIKK